MKRGALFLTLIVAVLEAACSGGGSSTPPPPPPQLGFSNSSLKGQYAFTMAGQTFQDPNGPFIARIGTFAADGNGNITGGVELVNTASGGLQLIPFQNSGYQVSSDGRGGLNLTNLTGTLSFSITLVSTTKGYICQTDGVTTTSGTFELQDTSVFNLNGINGSYAFDNTGLDPNGNPDSIIGQLILNSGNVTGVFDENDAATASGPQAITNGTYSFSDTTNGIGTISFGTFKYDFVVVNNKKIHMIEVPGSGSSLPVTVGTADAQTAPPTTNAGFTGSFAFLIAGVGTRSQNEKAGRFTTDGKGNLVTNTLTMDDKQLGSSVTQIPTGAITNATYNIDTNFPSSGRGTVTFTDPKGIFVFIFYMSSATQGVIQDNGHLLVGDGVIMAQTSGPLTLVSFANNYGFNLSGVSSNDTTGVQAEEDFVGHASITGATSNNVTGMMDFSELNLIDPAKDAIHNSVISGALTISGDGTNSSGSHNVLSINATNPSGGPSSTFNFDVYVVDPTTFFVISLDHNRVTGGAFTKQITPP